MNENVNENHIELRIVGHLKLARILQIVLPKYEAGQIKHALKEGTIRQNPIMQLYALRACWAWQYREGERAHIQIYAHETRDRRPEVIEVFYGDFHDRGSRHPNYNGQNRKDQDHG